MTQHPTPNTQHPVVAVLYGPGINCHEEAAFAVEAAGLDAKVVNLGTVLKGEDKLTDYQAMIVPGGFSWGDHLGAGRVFGVHLTARLTDQLNELVETGKPILGICNGFQIIVEAGLLPDRTVGRRTAALLQNRSARFESRWVELLVTDGSSIWTKGLEGRTLRMPVAHGEGRLVSNADCGLQNAESGQSEIRDPKSPIRACLCYAKDGKPTEEYPANPGGTPGGVTGICDSTGLIFGMMPHPERASLDWHGSADGMELFKNLARYLKG